MFQFTQAVAFEALERLIGIEIPASHRDIPCSEFARIYYKAADDIDELLLIMKLEHIGDVSLGNPEQSFPSIRQSYGRRHFLDSLTLSNWCKQVAQWANLQQDTNISSKLDA